MTTASQNAFERPHSLVPFWTSDSHCPYDERWGSRCSGWASCVPAKEFEVLQGSPALSLPHIKAHCKSHFNRPTHWISTSDSIDWNLRQVVKKSYPFPEETRFAIMNVSKLDRLQIPWQRSDVLVLQQEGRLGPGNGINIVNHAWSSHYLVYDWISAVCIMRPWQNPIQHADGATSQGSNSRFRKACASSSRYYRLYCASCTTFCMLAPSSRKVSLTYWWCFMAGSLSAGWVDGWPSWSQPDLL